MSDLKVTFDNLSIETYEAWIESANNAEKVDRKAIQEIAYRIRKANFKHLLTDSQPLIFKAPSSFALFMPYFCDLREIFTYRLFEEKKVELMLQYLEENYDESENNEEDENSEKNKSVLLDLFTCIKQLNKDCQQIQNNRDRCQKG